MNKARKFLNVLSKMFLLFIMSIVFANTATANLEDILKSSISVSPDLSKISQVDSTNLDTSYYSISEMEIPVLYDKRSSISITGAVSYLKGSTVSNIEGTNRLNTVNGRMPGLFVLQEDGLPGSESSKNFIRGRNGFGISGSQALVLVDGFETDLARVNPHDIESITVLKDAATTALYGLRSTNGIILIETKRGRSGDIQINYHSSASMVRPNKMPEFLGSADYARLYNEATINEGGIPPYTEEDIVAFEQDSDPYRFPNNNYMDKFLKDYTFQFRNTVDITGGTEKAEFLFLVGYLNNNGIFQTETDLNTYNTNNSIQLSDIHANLNFKVGKIIDINFDMKAQIDKFKYPGSYVSSIIDDYFGLMYDTPPLAYPIFNKDMSLGGTTDYRENFYGKLNNSGYSEQSRLYMLGNLDFSVDMSDLVNGLSFFGRFGYRNINSHVIDRSKQFAVYQLKEETDDESQEVYDKIGDNTPMQSVSNFRGNNAYFNGELGFEYSEKFGNSSVHSKLFVDQQYYRPNNTMLPNIFRGFKFNLHFNNSDKYLVDLVMALNGNNQYPEKERYGFFPALGLGWVISNENFMQKADGISLLKIRASAGITGNTFNPYALNSPYFAYLSNYQLTTGYVYGTNVGTYYQGFEQTQVANNAITWEECFKMNIGLDIAFLKNRLGFTTDFFYDKNSNILVDNANSGLLGANFIYPVGIVENKGFELEAAWHDNDGDFGYFVSANATFAKNKIIEQKEQSREYEWMLRTGNPVGTPFGYVFDRYFTENDDFSVLPDQSLLGTVMPGDLKYKDLNNDGVINEYDQQGIGKSNLPETYFGLNFGISYKSLSLDVLFQGMANTEQIFRGGLIYEFENGKGNVNDEHLGRWNLGDGQNASYPRLGIHEVSNNRVASNYWIRDLGFVRLKSLQLKYHFDNGFVKKLNWMEHFDVFLSGYNLLTWQSLERFDAESTNNGKHYPVSAYYTLGFNIGF